MESNLEKNDDKWSFPPLLGGGDQGLSQGSIDFKSKDKLCRESTQNFRNAEDDNNYKLINKNQFFFRAIWI